MNFEYTPPQTDLEKNFGGHTAVNAFGKIILGDDVKFETFLRNSGVPPRTTVYIDSGGGDVETAINIGHLIRDNWLSTAVGSQVLGEPIVEGMMISREYRPGDCMSAATLMYLGGRLRYFGNGSKFGVHQFSFKNPTPDHIGRSQIVSSRISRYISDMGIGVEFLEISSSVDAKTIEVIPESRLRELAIVTGGETPVSWTTIANHNMISVRGERDSIFGHHKVLLSYTGGDFILHFFIESQNREDMLQNFAIAELTFADEDAIDISDRVLRFPFNAYTNAIIKISQDEARRIIRSKGFGIQIRASKEAPMFLGISPMSTKSGSDMLISFFSALTGENLEPQKSTC